MTNSSKMTLVSSEEADKLASCFFDYMLHGKKLLSILKSFKKKEGRGTEYMSIFFRNDFEEWDEDRCSEDNVALMFEPPGTCEIGYLTLTEFYTYIEVASKKYLEKFPLDAKKINYLLNEIKFAFGIEERPVGCHSDDFLLRRTQLDQQELSTWLTVFINHFCTIKNLSGDMEPLSLMKNKIGYGTVGGVVIYFKRGFDLDDMDACGDNEVAVIVEYPSLPDEAIGYLSFANFYELLVAACKEHNTSFPQNEEAVQQLLQEIKVTFNLE